MLGFDYAGEHDANVVGIAFMESIIPPRCPSSQAIGGAHVKIEGFYRTCQSTGGLTGTQGVEPAVLEHLVETALAACEKFYPAFMLALWGGKTPTDAVEAAMLETVGEA